MDLFQIETKAVLNEFDPHWSANVFVEEEGRYYFFDHTSKATPNGDDIIASGKHAPDHPQFPDQPFMTGNWIRRAY